jgi:hypothetical protein
MKGLITWVVVLSFVFAGVAQMASKTDTIFQQIYQGVSWNGLWLFCITIILLGILWKE